MSGVNSSTSSSASPSSAASSPIDANPYGQLLKTYRAAKASSNEETHAQFALLPETVRNQIYGITYTLAGSPQNVEWNWGELHVFDSLPKLQQAIDEVALKALYSLPFEQSHYVAGRVVHILSELPTPASFNVRDNMEALLQSLDYCFTGDLTPELQAILDGWATEVASGENRQEARGRIIGFLNERSQSKLELSNLQLKTLPPIFNTEPFINRLGHLDLSKNQLTALPAAIGNLHVLKVLYVSDNPLIELPAEIGNLQVLDVMFIQGTLLTSLPAAIGNLRALVRLYVAKNQFTTLPAAIGSLPALKGLYAHNNPTLTGVPMEILNLPNDCDFTLEGTGFSDAVLLRLNEACHAPLYNGPRISFSIRDMVPRAACPTEQLLLELFTLSGLAKKEFPKLLGSTEGNHKENLNMWLNRLSDTADYKKGGEFQKAFASKVLSYLQAAEDNEQFRGVFFGVIDEAATTCGDRVALSILHVSTAYKIATIDTKNIKGLADLLINEVWPMQMLEQIARDKVNTLRFYDEIEIYLGYPILLRERLKMPIDVEGMLYDDFVRRTGALTQKDLDEAAKHVQEQQNDDEKKCRFLIGQDKWIESLRANYSEKFVEIDKEIAAEEDKEDCDYIKLGQMREEKLISLTVWALGNM